MEKSILDKIDKKVEELKKAYGQVLRGQNLIKSIEAQDYNSDYRFSIGSCFTYSSIGFALSEGEFEQLRQMNLAMLRTFVEKRKKTFAANQDLTLNTIELQLLITKMYCGSLVLCSATEQKYKLLQTTYKKLKETNKKLK